MTVYALYNKKVPFWNPPTFADTPKEAVTKNLRRYCLQNQDEARKAHYDECDLYYLGEFDEIKGKFALEMNPEFLCSLSDCFDVVPPPEPAKFSTKDIQQLAFMLKAYLTTEDLANE